MNNGKKVAAIAAAVVGAVFLFCVFGCLAVNSYLNKISYDTSIGGLDSETAQEVKVNISPVSEPVNSQSPAEESGGSREETEGQLENGLPDLWNDDVFHVLLIGSDSRTRDQNGRSDSMILISVNRKTSKIIATSLLRDIYLQIPGSDRGDRLNTAYTKGGAALLLRTIRENFKINVYDYIAVDFFSFISIIDKLGGITVDISDEELKVANGYIYELNHLLDLPAEDEILIKAGCQTLSGKQALGYARIRYVGNADFERTDRQRLVLEQVFYGIKEQNIMELGELLNEFLPEVTTSLSRKELFTMLISLPVFAKYSLDSWRIPVEDSYSYATVRTMSVLKIDFDQNIAELQRRIYG